MTIRCTLSARPDMRARSVSLLTPFLAIILYTTLLSSSANSEPIDFFPLEIGRVRTYSYYREYYYHSSGPYLRARNDISKDSGLVVYRILDSTRFDDTTTRWTIREVASIYSTESHLDSLGQVITSVWSHVDSGDFRLLERTTGIHKLETRMRYQQLSGEIYRFVDSTIDTTVYVVPYDENHYASFWEAKVTFTRGIGLTGMYNDKWGAGNFWAEHAILKVRLLSLVSVQDECTPASESPIALLQNYPNPFNPRTTIRYGLPNRSHVTLTVFNTLGQEVGQLVNGDKEAGHHEVRFEGSGLASGVYLYRMQAGRHVETKRLLLVR